jgi:uncharacterized membrane protein
MVAIQRIFLHVTGLYILLNGGWMTLSWVNNENNFKDSFPLFVGIASLVFGLIVLIISFMKFDKKDRE